MAGNIFGNIFKLTSFGESHGIAIGGIIEGCPSGIILNFKEIQNNLNRRRPGQSNIVTQRKELDQVHFLSGIFEEITTGMPIGFIIYNQDQKSYDYKNINNSYRPSHADFTYYKKYGIRDYRGGGRSSARETSVRVVAGSIAKQLISNIEIIAFVSSVGNIKLKKSYKDLDFSCIDDTPVRCPDIPTAKNMINLIHKIRKEGDTIGGTISCIIKNVDIGLGDPIFDKLHANLGKAMLSINAVKGFEYGSGFSGTEMKGSDHNDSFKKGGSTITNFSGGIQGGISNGMDIYFRVAFKPVATIMKKQNTIDNNDKLISIKCQGRHDPCVVPRAVPIVEAMASLVLADHWLLQKIYKK